MASCEPVPMSAQACNRLLAGARTHVWIKVMTDAVRLAIHPSVVFRELDGEAVLLNLDSGVYYGLDAVGTRVWALVAEYGSARGVCDQMEKEYDVSPEVLERDVDRLIGELRDKGLLVPVAPT